MGYKDLAAAIVGQSIIDYQQGDKATVKEVEDFYKSDWFGDLCGMLNTSADKVLHKIHTSKITVPDEIF